MGLFIQVLTALVVGGGSLGLYAIWELVIRPMLSPINKLRGPKSESLLFGHAFDVTFGDSASVYQRWYKEYGPVMLGIGPLKTRYAVVSDLRAVKELTTRPFDYVKPYQARETLRTFIGDGLVAIEGEAHKRQRKLLNVCFYPATIKRIAPIFYQNAFELRDVLIDAVKDSGETRPNLDMYNYFLETVLNMIGLAGFDYNFDALHVKERPNELYTALMSIYMWDHNNMAMSFMRLAIPDLYRIPSARKSKHDAGLQTFRRITSAMLEDRKRDMYKAMEKHDQDNSSEVDLGGRDLLSTLVKANADPAIPDDQRLSDEEVLSQIKTFIFAGHETTATSLAWLTFELARNPAVQSKLREELATLAVENPQPTIDDLNALPYLEGVIRESMRLRPSIPYTMRVAKKDDVIPLAKPITDRDGNVLHELHVQRGDRFVIPIEGMNRFTEIWGPDANEFKPERWSVAGGLDTGIPGVWSSMMTFSGGPRSCIGYRFAIYEMKVILFALLPALEFEFDWPLEDITSLVSVTKKPYLKSEEGKGFQFPIRVKQYVSSA